ncbi:MAG TPA: tetratricopeptide repeat protein [Chthoniobacter sp.]|jgi:tetratricopeptide (TPR) repeat protein
MRANRWLCVAAILLLGAVRLPAADAPELEEAIEEFHSGDLVSAEKAFRKMLDFAPDDVYLLSWLGYVLLCEDQPERAEEVLKRALVVDDGDGYCHRELGIAYFHEQKYQAAADEFKRALAGNSDDALTHGYLAFALAAQLPADWSEFHEHCRRARELGLDLDPQWEAEIQSTGEAERAKIAARKSDPVHLSLASGSKPQPLALFPELESEIRAVVKAGRAGVSAAKTDSVPEAPGSVFMALEGDDLSPELCAAAQEAAIQFDAGHFDQAERTYREILAEAPRNLDCLSNLGLTLYRAGKLAEAEQAFKKALALAPDDELSRYTLGVVDYEQGKDDDAINELAKAVAINPQSAKARYYLGITASRKGWRIGAQSELSIATMLDAGDADAHLHLAMVLATAALPDGEKAREHYERALELGAVPDSSLEELIWQETGKGASVLPPTATFIPAAVPKTVSPLLAQSSTPAPAKSSSGAGSEKSAKSPAAESHPPDLPPILLPHAREAKAAFERGDYAEAEKIFGQILEKAPDNLWTLSNLGVTLFRAGKNQLAEDAFKKAIALAPEDGFSHCTLGIVYYQQGKWDDAIGELTKALAIDPNNATACNYLGITASQKGWQKAAREALQRATTLNADYADAHFNLAVVLATMNPPERREANEHYQIALKLGSEPDSSLEKLIGPVPEPGAPSKPEETAPAESIPPAAPTPEAKTGDAPGKTVPTPAPRDGSPQLPSALIPLGREAKEQFDRGNYLEAEKIYRQILQEAPDNLYAVSNLGVVLVRAGKTKLAEDAFKKAIKVEPDDAFSHCTLGIVYYQEGKYDDAVNELTKTLAIDPQNVTAHNYLGVIASVKGWRNAAAQEERTGRKSESKGARRYIISGPVGDFFTPLERERLQPGE